MTAVKPNMWRFREASVVLEDFLLIMNSQHGALRRVIAHAIDIDGVDNVGLSSDGWVCNDTVTDRIFPILALSGRGASACDNGKAQIVALLMALGNLPFNGRIAGLHAVGLAALSIWTVGGMPLWYEAPELERLSAKLVPHWYRFVMNDRVKVKFSDSESHLIQDVGSMVLWARDAYDRYHSIKHHSHYHNVAAELDFNYYATDAWAMRLAISGKIIV